MIETVKFVEVVKLAQFSELGRSPLTFGRLRSGKPLPQKNSVLLSSDFYLLSSVLYRLKQMTAKRNWEPACGTERRAASAKK
jgi:hypothetical protein